MKRLLLTGARGFIGRPCIPLLQAKGYEIHAVSSKRQEKTDADIEWHQVDLLDASAVRELVSATRATHLLHLAWNVEHGKYWTSLENFRWVQSSLELFRAFFQHGGKRILATGTCAEYDWRYGFCSEAVTPLAPHTLYGTCKHAVQMMLGAFAAQTGVSAAWARIFHLYGPNENPQRFVPSIICSLLKAEPVQCLGEGEARDFMLVEDAASALVAVLEAEVGGPINVGSGKPIFLEEMVHKIAQSIGRAELVIPRAGNPGIRAGEPPMLLADVTRLRREVGWSAENSLEAGIAKTVAWWRSQLPLGPSRTGVKQAQRKRT